MKLLKHQAKPAQKERRLQAEKRRALKVQARKLMNEKFPLKVVDEKTGKEVLLKHSADEGNDEHRQLLDKQMAGRRRMMDEYNMDDHYFGTAEFEQYDPEQSFCGENIEDICPCDETAGDPNCFHGMQLPLTAISSADAEVPSIPEACPVAPDMTNMKDALHHRGCAVSAAASSVWRGSSRNR